MSPRPTRHLTLVASHPDPSQLAPAECDQETKPPYIAEWMIAEGEAAFAERRAVRRRRWTIRLVIAASFVAATLALWRA